MFAEEVIPNADTGSVVGRGRLVTAGGTRREESMLEIHQVSVGDQAPTGVYANHQPTDSSPNGENSSACNNEELTDVNDGPRGKS